MNLIAAHVETRWMIRRDLPSVLEIDQECFDCPWDEREIVLLLRLRDNIGWVAVQKERVVGYMVYTLHPNGIHLLSLGVQANLRRTRIGTALIHKLKGKLCTNRRNKITTEVSEENLTAQLFLRQRGFMASGVVTTKYRRPHSEAYEMIYKAS